MHDRPHQTGAACVITVDPLGRVIGRVVEIASQETCEAGEHTWKGKRPVPPGAILQRIIPPGGEPEGQACYWPVAWMVPAFEDPDARRTTWGEQVERARDAVWRNAWRETREARS